MPSGTLARRPAVLLALGLCAFGGVVTLLGRLASGPVVEQKRVALTNDAGRQAFPAFSPNGQRVAYSAQPPGDENLHIFVRAVAGGPATQLTNRDGSDVAPVWSPDGATLAFLRIVDGRAQAILMSSQGGAERQLAEFDAPDDAETSPSVAWTKDGQSLAVVTGGEKQPASISLLSLNGGTLRRVTNPPAGSQGDGSPAISPDGNSLAFARKSDNDHADVYLCDLKGGSLRQLTFDGNLVRGLTWSVAGQDVIYSSDRGPGWRLWRLPAYGGSPREVVLAGNHATYPAVAPKGYRLAYTEIPAVSAIWMAPLGSDGEVQERQAIRSAARESAAVFSPDGTKIATVSEQSGTPEIWVGSVNGGDRTQITRLDAMRILFPHWSPDGKTILFETLGQSGSQIYTVPSAGGRVTRVLTDGSNAAWSRDGKTIFYCTGGQIWHASLDGSNTQPLTRRLGSFNPTPSEDGKWVFFWSRGTIWRVPPQGGKEEEFVVPEHNLMVAPMQATKTGLYYSEFERGQRAMVLAFYDFAAAKSRPVLRVRDADFNGGFSVAPDGKWVLYPKTDRRQTNLAMLENFR